MIPRSSISSIWVSPLRLLTKLSPKSGLIRKSVYFDSQIWTINPVNSWKPKWVLRCCIDTQPIRRARRCLGRIFETILWIWQTSECSQILFPGFAGGGDPPKSKLGSNRKTLLARVKVVATSPNRFVWVNTLTCGPRDGLTWLIHSLVMLQWPHTSEKVSQKAENHRFWANPQNAGAVAHSRLSWPFRSTQDCWVPSSYPTPGYFLEPFWTLLGVHGTAQNVNFRCF